MDMALVWLMRGVGILWIAGGALVVHRAWQWRRVYAMTDQLEAMAREMAPDAPSEPDEPDDRARDLWIGAGGVLTFLAGCALLAASRFALPVCLLLCLHQTLYLARQVRRAQKAADETARAEEALEPSARNAAVFAFFVAVCAIYLTVSGAYA